MNCAAINEANFNIGKEANCCDIDNWEEGEAPCADVRTWSRDMVEELSRASGMMESTSGGGGDYQIKAFDIVCSVGTDSTHFVNDPTIASALDIWRETDNMDDISEPSFFTQWDQSLNGTTWVSDGNPQNLDPVLLTPEMLEQNDKLNILWDEQVGELIKDQLTTLEIVAIGSNHGVAKCQYGGVFLTKGTLTYLQGKIGDTFNCWITFTNAKYPWRTVVNGVVN
jgi:hypothetical protein